MVSCDMFCRWENGKFWDVNDMIVLMNCIMMYMYMMKIY